jgi:nucleoside-diphosphate-sugar epimerase
MAQLSLLEICRKVSPEARIVFASTRQLYGRPRYLPMDEAHPVDPVDINGINGINKLSAELYHRLYASVYDLSTCVLRLTNTLGPRMLIRDARQTFLGILIRKITLLHLAELLIELNGNGDIRVIPFPPERKNINIGDYYSCHAKFERDTGWQPQRTLKSTLTRTLAYYHAHAEHYLR